MQAILSVAHATFIVELDRFTSQPPLTPLDGGSHGLDTAPGGLAVGSTTVEPFLGQLGRDGHDLEVQVRLADKRRRLPAVGLRRGPCTGCSRGGGSARRRHRMFSFLSIGIVYRNPPLMLT